MRMNQKLGIIGAPITIAQPNMGVDLGPDAIRHADLVERLKNLKITINDYGNVSVPMTGTNQIDPETSLKNLNEVSQGNENIAEKVKEIKSKGDFPLILGGDHSIAIGTIAGLHHHYQNMGVIWYDAHPDLNTGQISPSGNIHGMSLAASIGIGHDRLINLGGKGPKVDPKKCRYYWRPLNR